MWYSCKVIVWCDVGLCRDSKQPEYSFRVDLPKTESAPPLRTLRQTEGICICVLSAHLDILNIYKLLNV